MYVDRLSFRRFRNHIYLFFFFSSRRRHTRFDCDWSSDVCSSDLKFGSEVPMKRPGQPKEVAPCYVFLASDDADRKSTRLNSSHSQISYAVFCLKKKKTAPTSTRTWLPRA